MRVRVAVGGIVRRLGVLRRGIKRGGFQVGVQGCALGVIGILGVCHIQPAWIRRRLPRDRPSSTWTGPLGPGPGLQAMFALKDRVAVSSLLRGCRLILRPTPRTAVMLANDRASLQPALAWCILRGRRVRPALRGPTLLRPPEWEHPKNGMSKSGDANPRVRIQHTRSHLK